MGHSSEVRPVTSNDRRYDAPHQRVGAAGAAANSYYQEMISLHPEELSILNTQESERERLKESTLQGRLVLREGRPR